jgi:hypothetical protein
MIKLQISHIVSSRENGSTHHRTTMFHCYNAAARLTWISLTNNLLKFFVHKMYLCQAFMHVLVGSAEC